MMAERYRLRDLEMGEAGHHRLGMLLGALDQDPLQGRGWPRPLHRMPMRTHSRKSVATWSLRDRAVCSRPAAGPISSASRCSTVM